MAKIDPDKFLKAIADAIEGVEKSELSLDLPVKEVSNWDSLARLTVVAELEERFQVNVGLGDLARCETLAALLELAEERGS